MGPRVGVPAPLELQGTLGSMEASAKRISGQHPKSSEQLVGLLVLIRNYLNAGTDKNKGEVLTPEARHMLALNYPKRIADAVLARTNFAKLFKLLPSEERNRFVKAKQSWVPFVLSTVSDTILPNDSVIERGIQVDENDPTRGITKPALKVKEWLLGMLDGVDLLPTIADAESMGGMDQKTEKVGASDQAAAAFPQLYPRIDVGIFEFRGAQAHKIPLNRWRPFAQEFQQYITAVHNE